MTAIATDLAFWSAVVFILFAWVLVRFLFPPLISMLKKRQADIFNALRQAEVARSEARDLRERRDRERAKALERAREMIEEARRDAVVVKATMLERIQEEIATLERRMEREIALAEAKARDDLYRETSELSYRLAQRYLATGLNETDHGRIFKRSLDDLAEAMKGAA